MIIYYKKDCAKCHEAVTLLNKNKCDFEIRDYLKTPPNKKEIQELLYKLKCKPINLVRIKEPIYIEHYSEKKLTDAEWIDILIQHPILIERPIVIHGFKAVIGRPPQLILNLIKPKGSGRNSKKR